MSKMIAKESTEEIVGIIARIDDTTDVIGYQMNTLGIVGMIELPEIGPPTNA